MKRKVSRVEAAIIMRAVKELRDREIEREERERRRRRPIHTFITFIFGIKKGT